MSRHPSRLVLLACFLFKTLTALAADLAVPQQYGTIQAAIDAAQAGDTVLVAPGSYFENLSIGKSLNLRSVGGAPSTVIDGGRIAPVLVARGTGAENISVSGLTITNGFHGEALDAGGLHFDSVVAIVSDSVVRDNMGCIGTGISSVTSAMTIQRNRISDNLEDPACDGADSGAIMMRVDGAGPSLIANNIVSGHRTGGRGAGIAAHFMNRVTIRGNLITGNEANPTAGGVGAGILVNIGSADVSQNVVHNNAAEVGGGIALFAVDNADRITLFSNVIGQNQASLAGSGVYLVYVSPDGVKMTSNVVQGHSAAPLVYCSGGPFVVPSSNRVNNSGGPEFGAACEPEPRH